jgi:hypothetical protein
MFNRTAGMGDLIRAHGGIADHHNLIIMREFVEHIPHLRTLTKPTLIVFPHAFIWAVVEIEKFQVFELTRGRTEEFFVIACRLSGLCTKK